VGTKLRDRVGVVVWPPHLARVRTAASDPAPGPEDFADAKLREVCPLVPGVTSIDLWVVYHGKFEVLLAVDVLDARREPVARFLDNHKGKTITELGNLDVNF
jgi:hypothetical protein